jgi:hypothetical protein
MQAINHSLTGALIGLTVADPVVAMPLALASHFALDSIPHFGNHSKLTITSRRFIALLVVDGLLCLGLVALLAYNRPVHWFVAIICAFLAASPDLLSFNHFRKALQNKSWAPNFYHHFAKKIQWFEKPIGIVVEAVWFIAFIFCLSIFLRR